MRVTVGLSAGIAAVALVYLLQAATPLRVEDDSTEYLLLAARLSDGLGYPHGASFPPGLPALVAALDVFGAARSWGIVLMNIAFVAIGLAALAHMLKRDLGYRANGILAVVLVTALSSSLIRYASHPLSEAPFVGLAFLALAAAAEARRRQRLWPLVIASAFTLAAIATRSFGIVLVPALVAGLPTAQQRRIAIPVLGIVGLAGSAVLGPSRYLGDAGDTWSHQPVRRVFWQVGDQLRIAGELAVNVPLDHAPAGAKWLYLVIGIGVVALVAYGAAAIARCAPVLVTYLAASTALLLAWPLTASRLAVPLLPVIVVCVFAGVVRLPRLARRAALAWAVGFAVIGITALVVTTRLTFAGDTFPDRYSGDDGGIRSTYRVAWGVGDAADEQAVLPRTLWVLRRYESRAHGDPGPLPPP